MIRADGLDPRWWAVADETVEYVEYWHAECASCGHDEFYVKTAGRGAVSKGTTYADCAGCGAKHVLVESEDRTELVAASELRAA